MTRDIALSYLFICVLALTVAPEARCTEGREEIQPLIAVTTTKTMQKALADVKTAITSNNYVFIREQSIFSARDSM